MRAVIALCALVRAVEGADHNTWRAVWSTGFVSELARFVVRECFCGYTKEQLKSYIGQAKATTVSVINELY